MKTSSLRRFQAVGPPRDSMAEQVAPEWRPHAVLGALMMLDTLLIDFAPAGPWDSESFTLGVIGLTGLALLYVAWYRVTFKRKGLIPWMDLWKDPSGSSRKLLGVGIVTIALAWLTGNPLQDHMPDPAGLVLTLIGLLMVLQAVYVMLSIGPLADQE